MFMFMPVVIKTYPPSAVMPKGCYFINAIERQQPIDEEKLNPEDNVEEFTLLTDADLAYYKELVDKVSGFRKSRSCQFRRDGFRGCSICSGYGIERTERYP